MRVWGIEIGARGVKFVDCSLLGLWMEKKFRKRPRVKYITFRFCVSSWVVFEEI